MIVLLCFVGALATVLVLAVEHHDMKAVESKAGRSRMRELASLMESDDRLRAWNGKRPRGLALHRRRD